MTICTVNEKVYIGSSCHGGDIYKRAAGNSISLSKDIKRFGIETFRKRTLFSTDKSVKAQKLVKALVKKYDSDNPKFGYN